MTATVLQFPRRPNSAIRETTVISLYTDAEVRITVAALNLYTTSSSRIIEDDLAYLDADHVEYCLKRASIDDMLSIDTRREIIRILNSIEHTNIRQQM